MAIQDNAFGLSLLKEPLRNPANPDILDPYPDYKLKEPVLDYRSVMKSAPNDVDRGLLTLKKPAILDSYMPAVNPMQSIPAIQSSPASFLKELESTQKKSLIDRSAAPIVAEYNQKMPARVTNKDLHDNDAVFDDRRAYYMVKKAADEFGINPGLLAEHLVSETKFGSFLGEGTKNLKDYTKTITITSTELGLDDFVRERATINKVVKNASTIPYAPGVAAAIPAESTAKKYGLEEIPDKEYKSQARFSLEDGVRATAAYIKYKEKLVLSKNNLGADGLESVPPEVKLQLSRLLINPGDPTTGGPKLGTKYWISQMKQRNYQNLFDFSDRDLDHTTSNDIRRRATIHTARAIHLSNDYFDTSP